MPKLASITASLLLAVCGALSWGGYASAQPQPPDGPVVRIEAGSLRGVTAGEVTSFRGIPYAAAPVGVLRWRMPQPAAPWQGVRAADRFGPECMQSDPVRKSENCLTLNVWRPAGTADTPRPVMVWIHGGGLVHGQTSLYPADALARQGVVVVSMNYRMGRLGFFAHPALAEEAPDELRGNYGFMDQRAALQWVQRNIAAFGGDPGAVTIFGQSAGGGSVLTHLTSPLSDGLFHRAILQSPGIPTARAKVTPLTDLPEAEARAVDYARSLGVTGEGAAVLKALRALPAGTFVAGAASPDVIAAITSDETVPGIAGAIRDGKLVTQAPEQALASGRQFKVPVIIGANSRDLGAGGARTADELFALFGPDAAEARRIYDPRGDQSVDELRQQILADRTMTEPARHLADMLARAGQPVWLYRFSYVAEALRGDPKWRGAPHGLEIPYTFDMPAAVVKDKATAADKAMAALASAYWVSFGKTGDPNGDSRPQWPRHDPGTDTILDFGNAGAVVGPDPLKARLDLWQKVWAREAAPTPPPAVPTPEPPAVVAVAPPPAPPPVVAVTPPAVPAPEPPAVVVIPPPDLPAPESLAANAAPPAPAAPEPPPAVAVAPPTVPAPEPPAVVAVPPAPTPEPPVAVAVAPPAPEAPPAVVVVAPPTMPAHEPPAVVAVTPPPAPAPEPPPVVAVTPPPAPAAEPPAVVAAPPSAPTPEPPAAVAVAPPPPPAPEPPAVVAAPPAPEPAPVVAIAPPTPPAPEPPAVVAAPSPPAPTPEPPVVVAIAPPPPPAPEPPAVVAPQSPSAPAPEPPLVVAIAPPPPPAPEPPAVVAAPSPPAPTPEPPAVVAIAPPAPPAPEPPAVVAPQSPPAPTAEPPVVVAIAPPAPPAPEPPAVVAPQSPPAPTAEPPVVVAIAPPAPPAPEPPAAVAAPPAPEPPPVVAIAPPAPAAPEPPAVVAAPPPPAPAPEPPAVVAIAPPVPAAPAPPPPAPAAPEPVTIDNFIRAESDGYFAKAEFGRLRHARQMAPIDSQDVVRMNRDTLYSSGVFDLDAGPLTVTLPDAGRRFMSVQAISQDHYTVDVAYAPARLTLTRDRVGTRYVYLIVRTLAESENAGDVVAANALQNEIKVEQAGMGRLELPLWDKPSQDRVRDLLTQMSTMRASGVGFGAAFGAKGEVEPISHLIGTAIGWGGNPPSAAIYRGVFPKENDGATSYRLRVSDVPVDGFWSISVYDAQGFFKKNDLDRYSLNNLTARQELDGSYTVRFGGCGPDTANCLPIMPGWNYTVRLYRPRAQILSGSWQFPEAQPVR